MLYELPGCLTLSIVFYNNAIGTFIIFCTGKSLQLSGEISKGLNGNKRTKHDFYLKARETVYTPISVSHSDLSPGTSATWES